jgi:hypothetical protein
MTDEDINFRDKLEAEIALLQKAIPDWENLHAKRVFAEWLARLEAQVSEFHC